MLRLHLIPETPAAGTVWACAEIRLLRPYRHPWMRQHLAVTTGPALPPDRVDAVVLQRGGWPEASVSDVAAVIREVRRRGARLVYDLDDDLLSEHPYLATEASLAAVRPRARLLLREADLVVASTEALAARLRPLNPHVLVWQNAVDETLADGLRPTATAEGADLGYFGTLSHLPDLLAVVGPLEAGLHGLPRRPSVELCGISSDPRIADLLARGCMVRSLPVNGDYAGFVAGLQRRPAWKAGLAPVAEGAFNRSKSDIKFLDYALAGIPGVYADCASYASVSHGETGLKVPLAEFGAAVRLLLEEPQLRRDIRVAARRYVLEQRTLARRAPELWTILQQAL